MSDITFGSLNFDRGSIPDHLRDLSSWPAVDISALEKESQADFEARRQAIELFVESPSTSLAEIKRSTGIDPKSLYRIIRRCLAKHPDGRIYGFRAAVPYERLKEYQRTQSSNTDAALQGKGLAGAFAQLLNTYPQLRKFLDSAGKQRRTPINSAKEVRKAIHRIHKEFLAECRKAGVKPNEYPFNQDLAGLRSLASYLKQQPLRKFESAARDAGADHIGPPVPADAEDKAPPATRAFEVVEFDGHKIDLRITLKVIDPLGFESLVELTKIWILVLLDVASRAVIGYKLALSVEYNKDDVAGALQAALTPFRPRAYKIPGLTIRIGGGFPSSVLPQAEYACWEWFRFDGAKAHLAVDTLMRLTQVVGCWPDNGPKGQPNKRKYIERFFAVLAANFAHRLPGTTGSDPGSIERALADPKGDLSLLVELDELEEMVEVAMADYNGHPHGGIFGRTPLEAMAQLIARDKGYVRTLPRVMRSSLCLLQEARILTIRGNLATGVRPHINFLEVRYSSDILSSSPGLIGKKLRIYFDVRDIRMLKAFFEDGSELGVLKASRPWCYTPHSIRIRREINRLVRMGKLKYRDGDDPVEAWEKLKRRESRTSKRAATALAKAKRGCDGGEAKAKLLADESSQLSKQPRGLLPPPQLIPPADSEDSFSTENQVPASALPPAPRPEPANPPQPRLLKLKRTFTF